MSWHICLEILGAATLFFGCLIGLWSLADRAERLSYTIRATREETEK